MQLSNRQIQLVTTLLTQEAAITTKQLATELNVSIRTVKNDLKVIQEWLAIFGDFYRSKPRIGIWLAVSPGDRQRLKAQIFTTGDQQHICTPTERVEQIILLLAVSDGFITTQQIENKVGISKNTVIADLDKVETQLQRFQLQLERKNYYGYRIRGSELNVRSALEALFNRMFSVIQAPALTVANPIADVRKVRFTAVPEVKTVLNKVLDELELCQYQTYSDFNFDDVMTMVTRMTICAVRLSMNHPINSYQPLSASPADQATLPYQLFLRVIQHYEFTLLKDEYDYLLRGVNPRLDDQNIAHLTHLIIEAVSRETGQPFFNDSQLQVNLFSHLLTKLSNKYKFTNEFNPFVSDLKRRNQSLFTAVEKALKTAVSANPAVINESFVAFVTLHFLVSLESKHVARNARIIYVCSTGLGVTSLIKKEIERNITNVEIAGFASITNVGEKIKQLRPDLIVSIFPITDSTIPVIQVNPLPSPADIKQIKAAVADRLDVSPEQLTQVPLQHHHDDNVEEITHTLLLNGSVIYHDLKTYLGERINATYREAFMIHVMMAVHRIYFHHSYDAQRVSLAEANEAAADVRAIKQIFHRNQLTINAAEISAILQYTRMNEMTDKDDDHDERTLDDRRRADDASQSETPAGDRSGTDLHV